MLVQTPGAEVIRDAIMLAGRAPSLHNSQPWRWVVAGARLQLWADRRRLMSATDRTGRELILSCGAVLDHLRVAMAATGWDAATNRLPDPFEPDLLATLEFRPIGVTEAQLQRAAAIRRRRTDRLPFAAPTAWASLEPALRRAVLPHEVMLDVVADEARPALAEASALTEQLRRYDTSYMSELRWWTSPFESDATHVPDSALVSGSEAAAVDVARAFPPAAEEPHRSGVDEDHSKILVLSTHHDDAPLDVLRCGEALSAVLLECTVAGLATCTLTHMTEMAMSRDTVKQLTGTAGTPQLLIRVGASTLDGRHVESTARRLVAEVLEFRE
ncbi:Acg family FMN-binding oxidoreductase [Mycobacterium terramassiliense]|uniref:NAD(P)H nitroreductase n=1 Tax=Mycobacterium terramassiliense TaxID=1841859 RepID=A0A2U3NAB5_9MYCO|nr:NAD(P)H nitroreductase [Mycobacterium terramassiliense]SPM28374.1 NAD(P)H nitroreductase [Mycobacterium terramassiliense]